LSSHPQRTLTQEADKKLGFKWKVTGSEKPTTGTEIKNVLLAEALKNNVEFTEEQWDNFKFPVADLSTESYIKVGENRYFKPDVGADYKKKDCLATATSLWLVR
jgi:hypothetical protein